MKNTTLALATQAHRHDAPVRVVEPAPLYSDAAASSALKVN